MFLGVRIFGYTHLALHLQPGFCGLATVDLGLTIAFAVTAIVMLNRSPLLVGSATSAPYVHVRWLIEAI